ncbi:MAG: SLBB domain-containing protein [candidate division KSB1 bacterium]|nr:SLBB domain-containing protein [candidate division KSB1 bacterium]MDZ7335574.1 SLBB domain-containing protein [candidate division KSB1 bacterium]MDZ7356446.1 SLBB domain-containing protein [candidate division KSB1 bacterium]MDZ7401217.1 SLBB domain-containing protein [candidate division KSB1 bacterium]
MTFKRGWIWWALLLVIIQTLVSERISFAQDSKFPRGAQYFLGTDDQLLIKVNIWGFVAKPGQYLVPSDTDVISLIAFAGGPRDGAKLSRVRLIRSKGTDSTKVVIDVNIKKFVDKGDQSRIPILQPNDTIIVSGSTWYHVGNFLGFVTKVATLVQIYWWIVYYSR